MPNIDEKAELMRLLLHSQISSDSVSFINSSLYPFNCQNSLFAVNDCPPFLFLVENVQLPKFLVA